MKIGDLAIPINFPTVFSRVVSIKRDYKGEPLYILENGMPLLKSELYAKD